jgi:subtilisin-like proprotein convertase family protein
MKRKYIGRVAGAAAASLALGGVMAQSAMAAAPDPPLYCSAYTKFSANVASAVAIPDATAAPAPPVTEPPTPAGPDTPGATVSRSITVSGKTGTIRDLDVITNITHPVNRELTMTLTKGSRSILLVKSVKAGRAGSNGYNGTVWDDSAAKTVAEANEDLNVNGTQLTLSPEGSLAAFIGDDPNGVYTLSVNDNAAGDVGTLSGFRLDFTTSEATQTTATTVATGDGGSLPDAPGTGVLEKTVTVSGAKKYLTDVDVFTNLEHHFDPGELTMRLVSPQGTTVMLSNHRGSGSLRSLSTTWNDAATNLITTAAWTPGQTRSQLVPEGSLGALIGQDPNGTWKLIIEDTGATDGFDLAGWNLNLTSADNCPAPPGGNPDPTPPTPDPAPPVAPLTPPATIAAPLPAPVCVKVGLGTKVLGATSIKKGKTGVVQVKVTNKSRTTAASNATTGFVVPSGFTVTKKPAGSTLKKGRLTLNLGTIAAGKSKTASITLKAGAKANTGLRTSTVSVSALCGTKAFGKLAVTIKKA